MHCPEGVQIHFHVCVLLCSAAAVCHHDLCWLLLCFIKYKSPRFFYFHVCVLLCSVAAVGHHDLFRLLHCFIESDLMGQGKTVLQGKCTVTCPKSHSIRFDGIGGDCAAGKVHSDLPKGSFNQICLICVVLVQAHVILPKMVPMTVKISIGLGFLLFQFSTLMQI